MGVNGSVSTRQLASYIIPARNWFWGNSGREKKKNPQLLFSLLLALANLGPNKTSFLCVKANNTVVCYHVVAGVLMQLNEMKVGNQMNPL